MRILNELWQIHKGNPSFGTLLLPDGLPMMTESMLAVILLWWVSSKGGATAAAIYGATVAAATFVAVLVASPFGDNFCKIKQIRYGTVTRVGAGLLLLTYSRSSVFQRSVVMLICAGHVVAMTFVNQARATVMAEFVAASVLSAALRIRKTVQAITGMLGPLVTGVALGASGVVRVTHRALAIPQHSLIRIFAVTALTMQIAGAIGPALMGIALTHSRVGPIDAAFGLLSAMGVLGLLWVPRLQKLLSLEHDHVVDGYAHQSLAIIAAQSLSGDGTCHGR